MIFNKPFGVLCQFTDGLGRPTLKDYIHVDGIYAVGRLDIDSEGLLLLTNDGELSHLLTEPHHKHFKTYWAQVEGVIDEEMIERLRHGVMIKGEGTSPAKVKKLPDNLAVWPRPKPIRFRKNIPTSWLEIKLREGKNHQVKKMTAAVGLPCLRLIRVGIGPIEIRDLLSGRYKFIKRPQI